MSEGSMSTTDTDAAREIAWRIIERHGDGNV